MITCACKTVLNKAGKCQRCGATLFDKTKEEVMREIVSQEFRNMISRECHAFEMKKARNK